MPITHMLAAAFIGLAIFCIVIIQLLNAWYDEAERNPRQKRRRRRRGSLDFETPPPYAPFPNAPLDVIALTHDRATAYRLFEEIRDRYPNRSEQWVWEKVKWDIERDRQ
ncbi:hypothetical protein [Phormidesmis sp. 146-33]